MVQINDRCAKHTDRVASEDRVVAEDQLIEPSVERAYYLYNKPVGIDCVCNMNDPDSIIHHIDTTVRVFPVGRLDKDSHGLMLLTNDGTLSQRLIHPDYYHEKEYRVTVDKPLTSVFYQSMSIGVSYGNVTTLPCIVEPRSEYDFMITLTQGMNRQIRRMCKALGYRVIHLQRVRIVTLQLDSLPLNTTRPLSANEVSGLKFGLNHCPV